MQLADVAASFVTSLYWSEPNATKEPLPVDFADFLMATTAPGTETPSAAETTVSATTVAARQYVSGRSSMEVAEEYIYRIVVVVVCGLGLICNIFNLIVLSRKSLTATMERLERSAHYGLIGKYHAARCTLRDQIPA
jgi:hypothetical protein